MLPPSTYPRPAESLDLHARLAPIVRRLCPGWLASEVDDLVQVAAIKIWKRTAGEGNAELTSSYLWRVAHSVLVDEIRKSRHTREVQLVDADAATLRSSGPDALISSREIGRAIQSCLQTLVAPRRRAVTAFLLGHSVPEIALLLGWTPKKAENLVYRGLRQMRRCLRNKGAEP